MDRKVIFITKTGLLLALALMIQIGLAPFAQPVVGPLVNMVLLLAVVLVGPWGAVTVGCLTPLVAFFVGIMGLLPVIPVIMLGNTIYALVFWLFYKRNQFIAVIMAAAGKFLSMAVGVRILAAFFVPNLPAPVVVALSLPQLYTALIGGFIGLLVLHYLPRSMQKSVM
ncbi:ECF transporter S component [Alkalibacter rhizosphaerae]|uniref:ECF transporter S component n=1 Tax=Alkalibacter rhizosphaerae TaxID=2815577 RepID=A0A974XFS9_9FIRM|nr:ECF transporter S component [Alkalibacter rhizosphaerae]QSX09044.1 ECF transporter S component [Alkalibacter rhizosphaerae]